MEGLYKLLMLVFFGLAFVVCSIGAFPIAIVLVLIGLYFGMRLNQT
jgi:hypothetical protein